MLTPGELPMQDTMRANPLFPSQRPERRVVRLRPGAPALLAQPVPNEANANSAVVLAFQVPALLVSLHAAVGYSLGDTMLSLPESLVFSAAVLQMSLASCSSFWRP